MKRNQTLSAQRAAQRETLKAQRIAAHEAALLRGRTKVNVSLLRPDNSYGAPDFVVRGY